MKLVYAIASIFFARFLVSAWFEPRRDADLAWQNWLGAHILNAHHLPAQLGNETFTAAGAHWVPQEWAFSLAVAWANAHHAFAAVAVASALAGALAMVVTGYRAYRRSSSTVAMALAAACAGFAMIESFGARAQVFAWLCLAILMLLLDLEDAWLLLAIPVVAIWANLHASAAIAPVLVAAWALGTWIEDRAWTPRVQRNAVLTAGCTLALFATPLLWELPRYAIALMNSPFRSTIQEWQPTNLLDTAFYAGVLPLLVICCYFGVAAPRERWRDGMLFAATVPLAFLAVRHLPVCALTIAPMAAQRLSSAVGDFARVNVVLEERFSRYLVGVTSAIASVAIVLSLARAPAIANVSLPRTPISRLAALAGTHNLFCEDFAWCSLALQTRNVRDFIDGRCDPFPNSVWNDYIAIERVHPDWETLLLRTGTNAVLASRGRPLAQALAQRSGWHLFYADRTYEVFLRGSVHTAAR